LKLALAAPAGIETVEGTVMLPVEVKATAVAAVTGPLMVTVQTAIAAGASVAGLQVSDVNEICATSDRFAVLLAPFTVAVTVAVWFAAKEPAVALNVAVVAPAGIETVAGTVRLPVEARETVVAAVPGADIVTLQVAVAAGASEAGLQIRVESAGTITPEVMDPPLPVVGMGVPSKVLPIPSVTPIEADEDPAASVIATFATTPSEISLEFMPFAIQIYALADP